jgi:hypothetical protein
LFPPRSKFLAPATKRPNNVINTNSFILQFGALAQRTAQWAGATEGGATKVLGSRKKKAQVKSAT